MIDALRRQPAQLNEKRDVLMRKWHNGATPQVG